jgi:hypothetical protein
LGKISDKIRLLFSKRKLFLARVKYKEREEWNLKSYCSNNNSMYMVWLLSYRFDYCSNNNSMYRVWLLSYRFGYCSNNNSMYRVWLLSYRFDSTAGLKREPYYSIVLILKTCLCMFQLATVTISMH